MCQSYEMGKLKYMEPMKNQEQQIGRIDVDDVKSEIDYWSSSLVCYALGANPPFAVMNGYLRRIWGKYNIEKILLMPNGSGEVPLC